MNSDKLILTFRRDKQWPLVMDIAQRVERAGGRVLIVGGAVRDALLLNIQHSTFNIQYRERGIKDFDLEVYGVNKAMLKRLLLESGRLRRVELKEVGKQFGVFNLGGLEIAIPRTDSRTKPGMGRKPKVISQPGLTFEQASRRRDLTINAMAYDPLTRELMDEQGGLKDLKRGLLRVVDPDSFGDDPLRVLRVMQFAGRFGFTVDPQTIKICRCINLKHLTKERVGEEWIKMLLKSLKPSLGLEAGRVLGVFKQLHPALAALKPADWKATRLVLDRIAVDVARMDTQSRKSTLPFQKAFLLVALCHRLPQAKAQVFLRQINCSNKETDQVLGLLKVLASIKSRKLSDESVRRIAYRMSRIDVALTLRIVFPLMTRIVSSVTMRRLSSHAQKLHVFDKPPINLLSGKDLLLLGVRPGKWMGEILNKAFERQLKGKFDDRYHKPQKRLAMAWVMSLS